MDILLYFSKILEVAFEMTEYTCVRIDIKNKEILDDIRYETMKRTHKRVSFNDILTKILGTEKAHLM